MLGGWGVPLPLALGIALTGIGALQRLPALGVIAIALGCGIVVATARPDGALLSTLARDVPRCAVSARVVEPITSSTTVVALDRLDCGSFDLTGPAGLAVIRDRVLDPGSRFRGEGFLVPLGSSASDLMSRRAGASALLDLDRVRSHPPSGAFGIAARLRDSLRDATGGLGAGRAALLHGLAIGDTSEISPVVMERFRAAGLTHLVAVSGSNVAIVLGAAALLVRKRSLKLRVALGALALATFVLVVGPDPSVLRATAMGALALVALLAGRSVEPFRALGVALIIVLALRPQMVHSVGLHLSAAATAGIVLLGPRLVALLRSWRFPHPLAVVLAATTAAQLAVAPILVATFGELSLIAPVANVAVAPAVPPATILTLAAALGNLVHPVVGTAMARAAEPFAAWILAGGDLFGGFDLAAVELAPGIAFLIGVPVTWVLFRAARSLRR